VILYIGSDRLPLIINGTEQADSSGNASDLHEGDLDFESRPETILGLFVASADRSRQMLGHYLKLFHDRFLLNPFQYTVH
jgi:hypothetical protein